MVNEQKLRKELIDLTDKIGFSNLTEKQQRSFEKRKTKIIQQLNHQVKEPMNRRSKIKFISAGLLLFVLLSSLAVYGLSPQSSVASTNLIVVNGSGKLQNYDGSTAINLASLDDVQTIGLLNNQVLGYNSSTGLWQNINVTATGGGNSYSYGNLTDASFIVLANGDIPTYNSTSGKWTNQQPFSSSWNTTVNQLISLASITTGQITGFNTAVDARITSASILWSQITSANTTVNQLIANYIASNPPAFSTITNVPAIGSYSYLIQANDPIAGNYSARFPNGTIAFTSTNATQLSNLVFNTLSYSQSVVYSGNFNLNGSITASNLNNIILNFNGANFNADNNMNTPLFSFTNINGWKISNGVLNGNAVNQGTAAKTGENGIQIVDGSYNTIERCNITYCADCGVYFASSSKSITGNTVSNCYLDHNYAIGIDFQGLNSYLNSNPSVFSNEICYSSDYAIRLYSQCSQIKNNNIHDITTSNGNTNVHYGIGVEAQGNNTVTGNTFTNIGFDGIGIDMSNGGNTYSQNIFTNVTKAIGIDYGNSDIFDSNHIYEYDLAQAYAPAIFVGGTGANAPTAGNVTISNNEIVSHRAIAYSISLQNSSFNTINGNTITSYSTTDTLGVQIDINSANTKASGNTITAILPVDIHGANTLVSSNNLDCSVIAVKIESDCNYASIIDNIINQWGVASGNTFYIYGKNALISGNYIYSSVDSQTDINLASTSANCTVENNYIYSTSLYGEGIIIAGTSDVVQGNTVDCVNAGGAYGIDVSTSTSAIVFGNNIIAGTPIYTSTGTGFKLINNPGYNPLGPIANPFSGVNRNILDSGGNNATLSSTWTYTNIGSPKMICLYAGTVTVVNVNGVQIASAAGPIEFTLQPTWTFSVTFSGAPTIRVFGL